jgi:hypothetical protein
VDPRPRNVVWGQGFVKIEWYKESPNNLKLIKLQKYYYRIVCIFYLFRIESCNRDAETRDVLFRIECCNRDAETKKKHIIERQVLLSCNTYTVVEIE